MIPTYKSSFILVLVSVGIAAGRLLAPGVGKAVAASSWTKVASGTPVKHAAVEKNPYPFVASKWHCYGDNGAIAKGTILSLQDAHLAKGIPVNRIQVDHVGAQRDDIGFEYHFGDLPLVKGQKVTLHFKARSKSSAQITAYLDRNEDAAFVPCWTQSLQLTPEWKDYSYTFTTPQCEPNDSLLVFKLGQSSGTTDFADFILKREKTKSWKQSSESNQPSRRKRTSLDWRARPHYL